MKIIKLHLFVCIFLLSLPNVLRAQTNTFPTSGSVGIGTISPASTLHIKQPGDISTGFIKGIRLEGLTNAYQISTGVQGVDNTYFGIADVNNNIYRLVIDNGGKIGIGTTSPGRKFDIAGTLRISNKDASWTTDGWVNYIEIDPANAGGGGILWKKQSSNIARAILVNQGSMYMGRSTADDASAGFTSDMVINTTGNIGIGTVTPGERLTVLDNNDAQGMGLYRNYSSASNAGTYLNFGALDESSNKTIGATILGQLNANKTSGELHFYTKTNSTLSDRMAIDQNGNVGIGTATPNSKLEISGNIFTTSQSNYLQFGTSASTAPYVAGDIGGNLSLGTQNTSKVIITVLGNVGIGTISPSEKLSVNGNISTKKLIVTQTGWSDYVFANNYKLRSLQALEAYINQNKHLPEIPTAKEVGEKGISVGDNQALLLKKIEELTLYVIAMQKQIKSQAKKIQHLQYKK